MSRGALILRPVYQIKCNNFAVVLWSCQYGKKGLKYWPQAELGEVIGNQKDGRRDDETVTVYKSLGLAVQDLVAAKIVFDEAGGVSARELPFTIFNDADVQAHAGDLAFYNDKEAYSKDTVYTELTGGGVRLTRCHKLNF